MSRLFKTIFQQLLPLSPRTELRLLTQAPGRVHFSHTYACRVPRPFALTFHYPLAIRDADYATYDHHTTTTVSTTVRNLYDEEFGVSFPIP